MKDLKIRKASLSNLDELVKMRLFLQKHLERANPLVWRYAEERKKLMRQEVSKSLIDKNCLMLIAEVKGEIVGFTHGLVNHRTDRIPNIVGILATVYVYKEFRRRSIGSQLVQELCQFFKTNNIQEISLGYIHGNIEAKRFWESLGFKPVRITANTNINTIEKRLKQKMK